MKRFFVTVLAATMCVGGCGTSEEEKRAEEIARAAEQAAQSAQQAAQSSQQAAQSTQQAAQSAAAGLEAMAKGLQQAASGSTASGERVDPVKFQELIALLPQVDGWTMDEPEGERMTSPFPTATAHADYKSGNARIEIQIIDSAFNQLLLTPIAMFLQTGYSQESTNGYEKATVVNGHPGWEKWDSRNKSGEVHALVNKRFLVNIEGDNIGDTKVLQDIAARIDFNRLSSLK
jgi:uncharacterized membrane protein YqiK